MPTAFSQAALAEAKRMFDEAKSNYTQSSNLFAAMTNAKYEYEPFRWVVVDLENKLKDAQLDNAERDIKIYEYKLAEARKELRRLGDKYTCLLYTSPSPRDRTRSRMPSSA